jgi:cyclopropane-fatty-acyl-phospholipid synthase
MLQPDKVRGNGNAMKPQKSSPLACEAIRDVRRHDADPGPRTGDVTALDRWAVRLLAWIYGRPPVTITLWNGEEGYRPAGRPVGHVLFHDRDALMSALLRPETGFGDAYSAGSIEVRGDLVDVLFRSFVEMEKSPLARLKQSALGRLPRPWRGTLSDSRRNIHYHYDLGNDFYALWLDREMVYTCAYFPDAEMTLEEAQAAKMDLVCRKLGLQPGMEVIEAGCGWGSLALHMARHYGVRVRAFNISDEQIAFARERAAREGMTDRVEYVHDDYRNIRGGCDAFVSVGMLEHVGPENYPRLGRVIDNCLREHGRGLIHTIGRDRPMAMNGWAEKRIFPGSYPPSLREMMAIFEPNGLSVQDVENLRLHYARTLVLWLERFESSVPRVRQMYDDTFVRAWRLYLASSAAAFLCGSLQLFQVVFARRHDNALPRSREHVYRDTGVSSWRWD